jgi:hypothetical protein
MDVGPGAVKRRSRSSHQPYEQHSTVEPVDGGLYPCNCCEVGVKSFRCFRFDAQT